MEPTLDATGLYRLPRNYADNILSWLEPTTACNLHCDGCPDMTVHEGRLLWSCRLEEVNAFGSFVPLTRTAPLNVRATRGL